MSKIVKILKKEYGNNSNAVDNRIFQHRNQSDAINLAHKHKLQRAMMNCRSLEELERFFKRRYEMNMRYKECSGTLEITPDKLHLDSAVKSSYCDDDINYNKPYNQRV